MQFFHDGGAHTALSILICHIPDRQVLLHGLLDQLCLQQHEFTGVEIIVDGEVGISIGRKRQRLLERSKGEYVCFVDDDDRVAKNYVARIMGAIDESPDVVGLELMMLMRGRDQVRRAHRCIHSRVYTDWYDEPDPSESGARIYYRCPNHLNPVRRDFALAVGFPDVQRGEDMDYSLRLSPLLRTEVMLDGDPLYLYRAGPDRDYISTPPALFGL